MHGADSETPAERSAAKLLLRRLDDEVFGGRAGNSLRWHLQQSDRALMRLLRLLVNEQHVRRLQRADDIDYRADVALQLRVAFAVIACLGFMQALSLVGVGLLLWRAFG